MHIKTINPLPLLMTIAMVLGIAAHDTNLDKAAALAFTMPAVAVAGFGALESIVNLNEQQLHTHVEQVNTNNLSGYTSAMPRLMPRDDENTNGRKRKLYATDADSEYHWPSI